MDSAAKGILRIIGPLSHLGKQPGWTTGWKIQSDKAGIRKITHIDFNKWDIVVFQCVVSPDLARAYRELNAAGIACVYELDDHLGKIHPTNVGAAEDVNPDDVYVFNHGVAHADAVIATT